MDYKQPYATLLLPLQIQTKRGRGRPEMEDVYLEHDAVSNMNYQEFYELDSETGFPMPFSVEGSLTLPILVSLSRLISLLRLVSLSICRLYRHLSLSFYGKTDDVSEGSRLSVHSGVL